MTHRGGNWGRAVALAACALAPAWAAAQGGLEVVPGPNGQTQVRFNNQRCVVFFDSRGQRVQQSSTCNRRQVERAEQADERWRAQNPNWWGQRPEPGAPQIVIYGDGSGRVTMDRDCVVRYDRLGRRVGSSGGCSDRELRRADRAMADYRREQGLDRPTPPIGGGVLPPGGQYERPGHGKGDVRFESNDEASVRLSNGCIVYYDAAGRRRGSTSCDRQQVLRADELHQTMRHMREYQKQNPAGSGA